MLVAICHKLLIFMTFSRQEIERFKKHLKTLNPKCQEDYVIPFELVVGQTLSTMPKLKLL